MKSFNEAIDGQPYVVVRNNQVELRKTNVTGVIYTFAQGATNAVLTGDTIVVNFKDGKVGEFRLTPGNNSAIHVRTV